MIFLGKRNCVLFGQRRKRNFCNSKTNFVRFWFTVQNLTPFSCPHGVKTDSFRPHCLKTVSFGPRRLTIAVFGKS